jgi:hypothetical protein
MFDKQYRFRGSHAERVTKLTTQFESISGTKVFERNVDVLCDAPLIGFLYNRRADLDNTKNPTTNEVYNTNVMGDRVIYSSEEMLFNFRLIMLLDSAYEHDAQKRIDISVSSDTFWPGQERYDSYVRGGVDVLYEKLVEGATSTDDFVNRLSDFVTDFDERFNADISDEEMAKYFIKTETNN